MSRFAQDYQIARSSGICEHTGKALEPGQPCIATLCEREDDEGFDRRDYATEAWEQGVRPERLFSYWKTIVPQAGARRSLLVDDPVLLDLFERLADDERPQRIAFRFILALILMRKRLLRFLGRDEQDGREHWQFRLKGADSEVPPISVINPRLSDDDVRELTGQLSEILQCEL